MSDSSIRNMRKEFCIQQYAKMSDSELRTILMNNVGKSYEVTCSEEAQMLLGESDACNELLRARAYKNKEQLELEFALPGWERTNNIRRKAAVAQLSTAVSYHGQLVAAILEEEGDLSAEKIRRWSDEFSALDNEEFKELLESLCKEEVLYVNAKGEYSLLSLCTMDLFPTNPKLWVERHGGVSYNTTKFIDHLIETGKPATEIDWLELSGYSDGPRIKMFMDTEPPRAYIVAQTNLKKYVEKGILNMTPIPDTDLNYYYFTMLGERGSV